MSIQGAVHIYLKDAKTMHTIVSVQQPVNNGDMMLPAKIESHNTEIEHWDDLMAGVNDDGELCITAIKGEYVQNMSYRGRYSIIWKD